MPAISKFCSQSPLGLYFPEENSFDIMPSDFAMWMSLDFQFLNIGKVSDTFARSK